MIALANTYLFDRALHDINDAGRWYREQRAGLELELFDDITNDLQKILQFPEMYRAFGGGFRQLPLKKFPYLVIYRVEQGVCYVFAIFHTAQDPAKLFSS